MTEPHTHRTIALALAEILPSRTNIFDVELIDATTDCTVRARIGESWAEREEISGIGSTMDEAVARLLDRAHDVARDDQIREIFDMSDEQIMADMAADGVTEADIEQGVEHIRAMCAKHKTRSDFARSVPPLSEIEIERLRQHAAGLATDGCRDPLDPLMVLGLVATLDRAQRPDAQAQAVVAEIDAARRTDAGGWLVAVWRDEPNKHTIMTFDSADEAAAYAQHAGEQWTHTYLARVVAGPGPDGHATIEDMAARAPDDIDAMMTRVIGDRSKVHVVHRDQDESAEQFVDRLRETQAAGPRPVVTVRGCVTAALAFAGVVGETMTPHELGMMTLGETWSLPGDVRIVRTTDDMFELWRDA